MSILYIPTDQVWVLSAPTQWIQTRPGGEVVDSNLYWCGGVSWSENITEAAMFATERAAKAHAAAMNLRTWTVTAVSVAVES